MKAYRMSKDCKDTTIEQKLEDIKNYSIADLLYVVREFENNPNKYDIEIIKVCTELLNDKNIMCIW